MKSPKKRDRRSVGVVKLCALVGAVTAALAVGASVAAGSGVDPSSYSTALLPGSSVTITKTVHTPTIPSNPDIVFLSDTTGSMGAAIANVQTNVGSIMNDVNAAQPPGAIAQFSAADYRDGDPIFCPGDAYAFNLGQALTTSLSDVQNAVNAWFATGGCDTPESQVNALYTLATSGSVGFRSGSTRIVVWFGDASGHDPALGVTLADAINALVAANIQVIAVPVDSGFGDGLDATGQATAVAAATGGQVLPSATPDQVSDAILAGLSNLPVTVTPSPTCDSGLSATFDAASKTVTSGTDATFSETLSVAPDAPGGILNCTVDFLLNGTHVDGFQQTVAVTTGAFAPGGSFVIGDQNSAIGTSVTFWGAQWWKLNSLSGGAAPAAFKGFALNPATPSCGVDWSTDPGNSTPPPVGPLPAFMAVIVTGSSSQSGSQIGGDTRHIVIVQTDPGYLDDPGHAGTGTIVAQVC